MCDKKNSVLFNDTKCIVLSPNFKLIDESQVLLRVPRKNNMYNIDLKNTVPKGGLTCLFAEAISDESKHWHRRLEAVNTACYVQNRVLVVKPHNKTLYELFHGRTPTLSYMRPFGCPVTILNTIDHLGKLDGKADEGTQSNGFVGIKASDNAGQARKKTKPIKDYILLPLWTADPPYSQDPKSYHDDGSKPSSDDGKKEEPKKLIHALKDPSWIEAMQEELLQFKLQEVWTLVDLPNGKRAIGSKWVFRNKNDERGIMIRNKARLVAQGYTQEEGIDYDEAFLYGKIEEEVYLCQPPGFEDPEFPDRVYKVEKELYGLHQAPRAWNKGDILLVQVYVDDIIFGSIKKELCIAFEKLMHEKFQMSSMGELTFFFGNNNVSRRRYLKGQPTLGLWYPKNSPFDLVAYTDSDYAGASLDRKSTTRDGKKIIITKSTIRRDLQLEDAEGVACLPNSTIFEQLTLIGRQRPLNIIASLKRRVKNLEKKDRSRIHRLKRLYKVGLSGRVESSNNEESLGEDASKQGRIDAIDADEEITLVSVHDVNVFAGEEVFATTVDDIILAQVLEEMKSTKPKKKRIVIQELGESTTTISSQLSSQQSQDKAEFNEEERLAREKAEKEEEANIALIET
ncbi:retrovirus-related pol polyprotein from transposon TNT 1-94 [Tanacetum coccineum]